MAFEGLKSKLKIAGAVAGMGLASLIPTNEADAQVVLGFSGSQNVAVGTPTEIYLTVNTQSTTNSINLAEVDLISWSLGLTNSTNATINNVTTPASNDAFGSAITTNFYSTGLGLANESSRDVTSGTRPSNINSLPYATATVTFNQPGSYTFSYGNASLLNPATNEISPVNYSSTFTVNATAVPEPSTYALIAGLGAAGAAAIRRRMRNEEKKSKSKYF